MANHTVYLPDEISRNAREAGLNLSGILREGVETELQRRKLMEAMLEETAEYLLELESDRGVHYKGRIKGTRLFRDDRLGIYLTTDERLILHDEDEYEHFEIENISDMEKLRLQLSKEAYISVASALGQEAVIDI